jgi:hypothetical protein
MIPPKLLYNIREEWGIGRRGRAAAFTFSDYEENRKKQNPRERKAHRVSGEYVLFCSQNLYVLCGSIPYLILRTTNGLDSCRYLFPHHLADDFRGRFVGGLGADTEPRSGNMVYKNNGSFLVPRKKTTCPVTGYFGRVPRYFFFQRPCFFFSHSCHWFLLLPEQMIIDAPAFHRMKYVNNVLVNIIIHNFEQIAVPVIPNQQIFVEYSIPQFIIPGMVDGMVHIFFTDAMPERRSVELNEDFYRKSGGGATKSF